MTTHDNPGEPTFEGFKAFAQWFALGTAVSLFIAAMIFAALDWRLPAIWATGGMFAAVLTMALCWRREGE